MGLRGRAMLRAGEDAEVTALQHCERVREICRQIYEDSCFRSDFALDHPLYRELVGMGEAVVPALLRRLEDFEDPDKMAIWEPICALAQITGVQAVPVEDAGRLLKVIEHWLRWGRERGISWDG